MKTSKRIALAFLGILVLLLAAAFAAPYFFKDKIMAKVKVEINKNVNAKVDFKDVSLSLFRHFPDVSVGLDSFEVVGIDTFAGLPLLDAKRFDLTLDLLSVIKSGNNAPMRVKSIAVDKPNANILVLANGMANYDIAKASDTSTAADTSQTNFKLELDKYSITDGAITYDDRQSNTFLQIQNLNHTGSGNFTSDVYDLITKTTTGSFTAKSGGMTYLVRAETDAEVTLNADMKNMKFTLKDNTIRINSLKVNTSGYVAMPGKDVEMDLKFDAPNTNFKDILSLVPNAYTKDYADVEAHGAASFKGYAKGVYNDSTMPAFGVDMNVQNADFKYPDLPMRVSGINAKVKVDSPTSKLDNMTVDIPQFGLKLGDKPVEGRFRLKTPISDPDIDTKIKGNIQLDEVRKAFPLEGVSEMSGNIKADIEAKTKLSYIDKKEYEKVVLKGNATMNNVRYKAEGMPLVNINNAQADFSPQNVKLDNFDAKLGKSDLKMSGTLDNILAYLTSDKAIKGNLQMRSNLFDANEWTASSEAAPGKNATAQDNAQVAGSDSPLDRFDMTVDADFKNILYDTYDIKNAVAKGHFTPQEAKVESLAAQIGKSDVQMSGSILNLMAYFTPGQVMKGNVVFRSNNLDVNELMGTPTSPSTPPSNTTASNSSEPVFDRFDMTVDADIKKIIYDQYTLGNTKAKGSFNPNTSKLDIFSTQIGSSDLQAKGSVGNVFGYLFGNETLTGNIDLNSQKLDLNELMGYMPTAPESTPATAAKAEPAPFLVPNNMDLAISTKIGQLDYTNLVLKNMAGMVAVKDEKIAMQDVRANTLGGDMTLNGGYNSQDHAKPLFSIDYKINKFDFQQAFNKLNTFEKLAPIGKFIDGQFNSSMNISGAMGKDMMPDLGTLNINGFLNTLNGIVKNFKPLGEINNLLAKQLGADFLAEDKLSLKDVKTWFEVKNGFVEIKPFDVKIQDIAMNIGGKHSLSQAMDYDIQLKIPTKKLTKGKVGQAAQQELNKLFSKVNSTLNTQLKQAEFINVLVNLKGSVTSPKTSFKLLGTEGQTMEDAVQEQTKAVVDKAVDSLKTRANEAVDKAKEKAKEVVDKTVDSVKNVVTKKVDEVVDKTVKQAQEVVKDKVGQAVKDKVDDVVKDKLDDKTKQATDKAKDVLDGWNPFKKKPKEQPQEQKPN
jgi:hypothetical protein